MSAADADLPQGALPPGTRLHEFELRRVLGIGGFGIVYLGFDHMLEREVAIKEYMPASLVGRTATMAVSLLSQSHAESFATGLRSFVNEAKLLARFDDPSLVKVYRYWTANNTAYMAMRYYHGANLKAVRAQRDAAPDEAWLRSLLDPLLGALERLHAEGIYHRDVSPDNIIVEPDGRPVLLDFGAARRVLSDRSQTLTAILKPAYAPIEQYAEVGAVKQGPWTDLYALGATMHFLLVGHPPPPATARAVQDEAVPLASLDLAGCSTRFLACIDWMLRPRPGDRPQSVAALRDTLGGRAEVPGGAADPAWERTRIEPAHEPTVLDLGQFAPPQGPPAWRSDDPTQRVVREQTEEPTQRVARAAPEEPTQRLERAAGEDKPQAVPPGAAAPARAPAAPAAVPVAGVPARPAEPAPAAAMHAEDPRPHTPAAAGGLKWGVAGAAVVLGAFGVWIGSRPTTTVPVAAPAAPAASIAAVPAPTAAPSAPAVAATPVPSVSSAPAAAQAPAPAATASTAREAGPAAQSTRAAAARPAATGRPTVAASAPAKSAEAQPAGPDNSAANPSAMAARPGLVPGASLTRTPTGASLPSASAAQPVQSPPPAAPAPATAAPAPTAVPAGVAPPPVRASAVAAAATASPSPPSAAPKPSAGEPEPMLRARKLGPAERCEGRVLVAYWSCVEAQCKNVPELANHPDCVKLRREQAPAR